MYLKWFYLNVDRQDDGSLLITAWKVAGIRLCWNPYSTLMVNIRHSLHMIRDTDFGPFLCYIIFKNPLAAKTRSRVLSSNGQRYIFQVFDGMTCSRLTLLHWQQFYFLLLSLMQNCPWKWGKLSCAVGKKCAVHMCHEELFVLKVQAKRVMH